ncbi:MAG: TIGR02186 family protein [Desulfobacteraceae bacterium]|nr:TIGR02186 family protein [Desulfobacteraceae bacterium]
MWENVKSVAKQWLGAAVLAALCVALGAGPGRAVTCQTSPDRVPIGISYHGAALVVQGSSDPGQDVIVRISSGPEDVKLKYKGKASGVFWMKMGDMVFKNVPNVYLLYTSKEIDRLLGPGEQVRQSIGYPALKERTTIESNVAPDKEKWFGQFLKLKQHENLYQVKEGVITRNHGQRGDEYRLQLSWPYQAPPGTYTVEALGIQDGKVVATARSSVQVEQVGMVKQLSELAFKKSAVYGMMAIVIALVAGFAVGAMFKKGGGAH